MKGSWDSIHVLDVNEKKTQATYKLTSTVMLSIETQTDQTGLVSLSGSLTRQDEKQLPVDAQNTHLMNMGRLIEDMENKLRNTIDIIYFGKTKDIVNELRQTTPIPIMKEKQSAQKAIGSSIRS